MKHDNLLIIYVFQIKSISNKMNGLNNYKLAIYIQIPKVKSELIFNTKTKKQYEYQTKILKCPSPFSG